MLAAGPVLPNSGFTICGISFATRDAESGVDLVTLKDLLGHSRLDMVLRYAHPSEKHRFDAIRKIEEMQA